MHPGKLRIAAGIILLLASAIVVLDFTVLDRVQPLGAADLRWNLLLAVLLITAIAIAIGALLWHAAMRHAHRLRIYAEELLGAGEESLQPSGDEFEALSRSLHLLAPHLRALTPPL